MNQLKRLLPKPCYAIFFFFLFILPFVISSQGVLFQNTGGDTLVYISDEGTTGSLKLKSGIAPVFTTDKLYNVGGSLHWGNYPLSHMWSKNGSHVYYNDGKVGIGEMTPSADLEVNGVDGVVFEGVDGIGTIPATGVGTRMMWYPAKVAFRVGKGAGMHWDDTNIGYGSFSSGIDNIASGNFSFVGGVGNDAEDFYSTAIGGYNSANGNGSVALGSYATAIGNPAIAIGLDVSATSSFATAIGVGTTASGVFSTAIGNTTISSGRNSMAMGQGIEVSGENSFAIGLGNQTGTIVSQDNSMAIIGGRVGINTTAPSENLVVKMGGSTWSDPHFAIENHNTSDQWDMTIGNNKRLFLGYNEDSKIVVDTMGKVGVGIVSPAGELHVSGEDGVLFEGTFGIGTIPEEGSGTRMMWYPGKAAFRAGYINGSQWSDVNTGEYSVALGHNTTASGERATALGSFTKALAFRSTAMGHGTVASGKNSMAIGREIVADGEYSIAIALNDQDSTIISQDNTMAIMGGKVGINTTAPSENLVLKMGGPTWSDPHFAIENYNTSDQWDMTIGNNKRLFLGYNEDSRVVVDTMGKVGIGTVSPAGELHVSGEDGVLFEGTYGKGDIPTQGTGVRMMWYPNKSAFRVGYIDSSQWDDINIGSYSTATGYNTVARGLYSTAMGWSSMALGAYSTAIGDQTKAEGTSSTALGIGTSAAGNYSFAAGFFTKATGYNSTALGRGIEASGNTAFAIGLNDQSGTDVTQDNTMAIMGGKVGIGEIAPSKTLHVDGEMEVDGAIYADDATGIGFLDDAGNNGIWVKDGGNVGVNTISPSEQFVVKVGGIHWSNPHFAIEASSSKDKWDFTVGNANNFFIGFNEASKLTFEPGGNIGIGTVSPGYLLEVNGSAGKPGGGSWSNSSDIRLKDIRGIYNRGLDDIDRLNPVKFNYKSGNPRNLSSDQEYIGFIAQEVLEVFPEAVTKGEDGYLDFNMHAVNVAMVNAIKELKSTLATVRTENELLREELKALKKMIEEKEQ